jgi:HK97 family phage portal protein
MINTLASLALDAGQDIFAPEKRWMEAPSEEKLYSNWNGLYYPSTDTGISVSEKNALTYMPVLACVRVISETFASFPCKVFRETDNGSEVAKNNYLYPIVHDQPNEEMSAFTFWEALAVSLCLYNNAYAAIEWNNAGRVKALWPLLPDSVTPARTPAGKPYWVIHTDDGPKPMAASDVLHIPGCLNITGRVAESLVKYAREAIGLGLAPQKYAANFYKNNARPGMYLTFPQVLNKQTRDEIRANWDAVHKGINGAGTTGVIEGGGEIKIPSVSQKDAEFSITRDQQLLETCRVYRMKPHMIADLSRGTFSNIEHEDIGFAKHTMTPYCRRSEAEINRKLIGIGTGYYAEFNMDALMRGDLLSRTQAHAQAINTAQMTPNEARRKENRPAIEGGDKLYIQGANVPLEMAGKVQAAPQKQITDGDKNEQD